MKIENKKLECGDAMHEQYLFRQIFQMVNHINIIGSFY